MATSQLGIYNDALRHLGEGRIDSLTEARKSRRELDSAWDGAVASCIEQAFWNFALRTVALAFSVSATPAFGYTYAFEKPTDWVRTLRVSQDERLTVPLRQFQDEGGYWFADCDTLYVRYVSNDVDYGLKMSRWPQTFVDFLGAHLAAKCCETITGSTSKLKDVLKLAAGFLSTAQIKDAMNEPAPDRPVSSWVASRGRMGSPMARENGWS